jgi:pimeloyl-ACP methyl ester carboxylesterase
VAARRRRTRVEERQLGPLEGLVAGTGPALVLLPGLAPQNGRPTGPMRSVEVALIRTFSGAFTTYWLARPTGLPVGTSLGDIAARTAEALRAQFAEPVNVLGISTGGSVAQQLAADHPELVRRLVLASTGYRLGEKAQALQQRMIEVAERGRPRTVLAEFARELVPPWRGRTLATAAMYAVGLRLYPGARDLRDLSATLIAEAGFDLRRLPPISARTLIIRGGRDRFYEPEVIHETARLIPGSHLEIYPRRGHVTVLSDRRAVATAIGFLSARQ